MAALVANTFDVLNTVEDDVCGSSDKKDESNEDEVYEPNDDYTALISGGFSMKDDDLDFYDGYEHQEVISSCFDPLALVELITPVEGDVAFFVA
nr:hypothetical protein [Tanacetum cinerariifolium]